MRVAFVDQAGDAAGGAEHSLALLLGALPADVEPHVVLFGDGAYAASLRERGLPVTVAALPAAVMATTRERPGRGLATAPGAILSLARTLRGLGADLVHTNTVKAHVLGAPAARLAGLPVVAHLRDILAGESRLAVRAVLARCSRERIAISRAVRDAFGLRATEVIANPLALAAYDALPARAAARAALGLPRTGTAVGIVGRINRWKGHDRFLRLAERLRGRAEVCFAVVGAPLFRDADFAAELRAFVRGRGLEATVRFVPWLDDVRLAYAALDVLCNCSDDEPFGRTIVEAAACGVPAVAFAGGGTADALLDGRTGTLVAPGDEPGFARALIAYLDDPALRLRHGAAARAFARTFDARLHAERVAAVLRRAAR